jgi:transposase-like protein
MKPDEEYVRRLERELTQARQECDILRKAFAYFSVFSRFSLILLQLLITFRRHHEVLTLAKVE